MTVDVPRCMDVICGTYKGGVVVLTHKRALMLMWLIGLELLEIRRHVLGDDEALDGVISLSVRPWPQGSGVGR